MKIDSTEFGELYKTESRNGIWKQGSFIGRGTPYVKMNELFSKKFISSEGKYELIELEEKEKEKLLLENGDLLFSRTSVVPEGVGKCSIICNLKDELAFDSNIIRVRLNKQLSIPKYIFYYFNSPFGRGQILSLANGAAVKTIKGSDLKKLKLKLLDLPSQSKIASILSAYDDLIENNLKRVKLLEEKASLHYKELIQELSFTKTRREEYLKDCLAFYIGGGWGEVDYKEGFTQPAYVIRGTDIPDTRGGNISGIPLRYHKESNLASRKMQVGDIVFEISNGQINNIGRTVLISERLLHQFDHPVMCASFAKLIRANEKVSPEFFYLYLNESQENGLLYQYKSNSANGINNFAFETFIDEVRITIPKEVELKAFTEKVKPIFILINNLGEQNRKLREARDILLPRMMSGVIEV